MSCNKCRSNEWQNSECCLSNGFLGVFRRVRRQRRLFFFSMPMFFLKIESNRCVPSEYHCDTNQNDSTNFGSSSRKVFFWKSFDSFSENCWHFYDDDASRHRSKRITVIDQNTLSSCCRRVNFIWFFLLTSHVFLLRSTPNIQYISEIKLFVSGFLQARLLAKKIVTFYRYASNLLSQQVRLSLSLVESQSIYRFSLITIGV